MSQPDDLQQLSGDVFRKARSAGLQKRMREFVQDHETATFKQVSDETATGTPLSELVDEQRSERI